jgi:hypothetical protein
MPAATQARADAAAGASHNTHVGAILEDFDESEYEAVLREIQRHVREWETQQTPAQAEWVPKSPLHSPDPA